ncbi:MAG: hypothetical protein JXR19_08525 [Bacteroidia bacterium]
MKHLTHFIFLLLSLASFGQTQIEILSADQLVYDADVGRYQRCIGNVQFKQDQVYMNCDSAWFYEDVNRIEAFGNIYIRQKDTFDLRGQYLEYDGDTRIARVEEEVVLTDKDMILKTERLDYDLNDKSAYYITGGDIANGNDHLSSVVGTYYSRQKEFHFHEEVVLINPEYEMYSDTLHYNTLSKTAFFFGPTYIYSEENTIFCRNGWYNTEKNTSQFSDGAYIQGETNRLNADSMLYNRNTGHGEAFGNILLVDSVEELEISGQYGHYQRFEKRTLITGNPIAIKQMDDEALYLKADTMIDITDSSRRVLRAFHEVKVFRSDLQAISDSMIYNFTDSTINFYHSPFVWTDSSQISGDTIIVYRNSEGFKKMDAFLNGFMIEKDVHGMFNQVSGKTVTGFFEEGELNRIGVNGNGQSVYYALDDSSNYSGVNDILCGEMVIYMDSSRKVDKIHFLSQPKASFYPMEKFPSSKSRLNGFNWNSGARPHKTEFN